MNRSIRNYTAAIAGCLALGTAVLTPAIQAAPRPSSSSMKFEVSAKDRMFMMDTARGGMAEVMAGKLAARKGRSEQVREFGQRMVDDHSKANEELKELARSKGVTLPANIGKHRAMIDKLSGMSGRAFDRAYVMAMVKDHKMDVAAFRTESRMGRDSEVKAWAGQTLPTLKEHLKMVMDIHDGMSGGMNRR